MKIDLSKSKAYAGGVGGAGTFLAGSTVAEHLTTVISWLISLVVANAPVEVAGAVAYLLVGFGSYWVGHFITYYAPPNQPDDNATEAYEALKRQKEKVEQMTKGYGEELLDGSDK